jgi:hypothetical protein
LGKECSTSKDDSKSRAGQHVRVFGPRLETVLNLRSCMHAPTETGKVLDNIVVS